MAKCNNCGATLNKDNSISQSGVCLDCQAVQFKHLESANGAHLAIFLCCGMFNVPCEPSVVDFDISNEDENHWLLYIDALTQSKKLKANGKARTFFDGVSDIRAIFGRTLSQTDFAKYISVEQERAEKIVGTDEQRRIWGEGNLSDGLPFTAEIYNKLDNQYSNWVDRYRGQTITPQLQDSIIRLCKWGEIAEHLLRIGNYSDAQKVQAMIQKEMESEQMRKKDEKPVEAMRMDALIIALEDAGLMEDGLLLTYDELVEALRDTHIKSQKYDYSLDVADQVIFDMVNSMRANADEEFLSSLPYEMKTEDVYGEFLPEETEAEKTAKKYAGLTKANFDPPKKHRRGDK